MNILSRRKMVSYLCCSCAGAAISPSASAKALSGSSLGCQVSASDLTNFKSRGLALGRKIGELSASEIRRTTRNAEMDRALDQSLKRLSDTFGVVPGFGFYDDYDGENAWATSTPLLQQTDGTVLFGDRLFAQLMNFDPSGGAVIWTAAHEFGHIWLYKSGQKGRILAGQSNVRRIELHADFLAGFYLGVRKRQQPSVSLYKAGHDIWGSGDTLYNDPNHHGTPEERIAAAEAGFKISYTDQRNSTEAFEAATYYVLRL